MGGLEVMHPAKTVAISDEWTIVFELKLGDQLLGQRSKVVRHYYVDTPTRELRKLLRNHARRTDEGGVLGTQRLATSDALSRVCNHLDTYLFIESLAAECLGEEEETIE